MEPVQTATPNYIKELYQHSQDAIDYLLPDSQEYEGIIYNDQLQLNLQNLRWFDYATNTGGELFDLWTHVKGVPSEQLEPTIKHWLLNLSMPKDMKKFSFTPDEMMDMEAITKGGIEIFPQVMFYPGTTTLLAGYNGSGKSTLATQIGHIMSLCNIKTFVLSPEMPPDVTARIVYRQATRILQPTPAECRRVQRHCQNNFIYSTTEDRITPDIALSQFDQAYEMGCRLMILDSLTCVRTGHELYQQADFADMLRGWTRAHPDCYVLVIAHMRKPAGYMGGMISRYDIRGAGEISDLAGHIWLMQRCNPFSEKEKADYGEYDARIIVDKNRANGKLVCKMLRFSTVQRLYHVTKQPPCYVEHLFEDEKVERIYP